MGWMSAICDAYKKKMGGGTIIRLGEDRKSVNLETGPVADKIR